MLEKGVTGEEVVTEGQRDVEVKTVNLERAQGLEVGDVGVHLVSMGGVVAMAPMGLEVTGVKPAVAAVAAEVGRESNKDLERKYCNI